MKYFLLALGVGSIVLAASKKRNVEVVTPDNATGPQPHDGEFEPEVVFLPGQWHLPGQLPTHGQNTFTANN